MLKILISFLKSQRTETDTLRGRNIKIGVLLIVFCIGCISPKKYVQDDILNYKPKCSEYINNISYYWKLDSLPSNGYRKQVYPIFHNTIIDSVSYSYLLDKLGTPHNIIADTLGKEIIVEYLVYDFHRMPNDYDGVIGFNVIQFIFDSKFKLLIKSKNISEKYRD